MERAVCGPCWTCRNRRIQCDQSQIPCVKCEKAGLECFDKRPFRWVKGVAIRGKMQGRSYESLSEDPARPATKKPNSILSKSSSVDRGVFRHNGTSAGASPGLPNALQDPSLSNLNQVTRYYIDYYNERICKLFIVYDSDKNPFRSLISYGLRVPVLQKAILALAARHHANTGQSFYQLEAPTSPRVINTNRDALLFKHQAIDALSHALSDPRNCKNDTTVASIFLLIFLDLLESGSDGWNFHLEGAKSLITSHRLPLEARAGVNQVPSQTVQEIREFITKQIYLIETLGSIFLRPKLLSQFIPPGQEGTPQEAIEKSFLGCPEFLLTAIQDISRERDSITGPEALDDASARGRIQRTTTIIELIQSFDCYQWASSLRQPRQTSQRETDNLCILSDIYKIGAVLYSRRVLDALTKQVTSQDDLVSELLSLLDALRDDQALFKCALWPIFVAGMECRLQAQRDFLTECLERFWVATHCLNAINAAKILQDYWQQEDGAEASRWIFDIGRFSRNCLLI